MQEEDFKKVGITTWVGDSSGCLVSNNASPHRWKEAIQDDYLGKVWKYRGHLAMLEFGDGELKLVLNGSQYVACGWNDTPPLRVPSKDMYPVSYPARNDVEIGLIRFVKDSHIRQLCLVFPGSCTIELTKGEKPSDLIISSDHLPRKCPVASFLTR